MTFPYSGDSEGQKVIALVKEAFQAPKLFASSSRHLIFVCGGDSSQQNLRSQFLEFAKSELPHLRLVLAEDAYRDLMSSSNPSFVNLAIFEQLVADLSDCIVLFPESFGSVAELGFFVGKDEIAKKLLTANPIQYQSHESFVNLGPLAVVNSRSDFRPSIQLQAATPDFGDIAMRLERYSGERRRKAFAYKKFNAYTALEQFFAIFELVRHLRIVHIATLPHVIKAVFSERPKKNEFQHLLAVLVAAKYVERSGEELRFLVASNAPPFLDIRTSETLLVAANAYLLRHHPDLYSETFDALGGRP